MSPRLWAAAQCMAHCLVALLCVLVAGAHGDTKLRLQATQATHTIALPATAEATLPDRFAVRVFSIPFPLSSKGEPIPLQVVRARDPNVLEESGDFPEEKETTARGLMQLKCGTVSIDSSVTSSSVWVNISDSSVPVILAPLDESQEYFPYKVAQELFSNSDTSATWVLLTSARSNGSWKTLFKEADISSCTLHPTTQGKGGSSGHYEVGTQVVQEDIPIQPNEDLALASGIKLDDAWRTARKAVCGEDTSTMAANLLHPPPSSFEPVPVTELVEGMPPFGDMALGMMKPVAKKVIDPMSGMMAGTLGGLMGPSIGACLGGGVGDLVPLQLSREISDPISRQVVPGVVEVVNDQLPPSVAMAMNMYMQAKLPPRITESVTARLDETLTPLVADKVNDIAPKELDQEETRTLGHILTKSLTQTLVPTVIHLLAHSPLTDYYCYYCHKSDVYCAYCQFSPIQNYFAQFYAGYYSTYYASYYNEFWANQIEIEEHGEVEKEEERFKQQALGQDVETGAENDLVLQPVTEHNFPDQA